MSDDKWKKPEQPPPPLFLGALMANKGDFETAKNYYLKGKF